MVSITREGNNPYKMGIGIVKAREIANHTKELPREWINPEGNHVTQELIDYIAPLIIGEPDIKLENGLPKYYYVDKDNTI
jgi:6-phosphofructokinase 1